MSSLSNIISPDVESYNLKSNFINVDLPEPVLPTIADVSPFLMSIEISFNTGKFWTYSKFKLEIWILSLKFTNLFEPFSIVALVFFKFTIRLNDAIAFWYASNMMPSSVRGHNNLWVINNITEYVATLISPSNAKKPPIRSVAVNPNNIAIRIIGINAAESFIAW